MGRKNHTFPIPTFFLYCKPYMEAIFRALLLLTEMDHQKTKSIHSEPGIRDFLVQNGYLLSFKLITRKVD